MDIRKLLINELELYKNDLIADTTYYETFISKDFDNFDYFSECYDLTELEACNLKEIFACDCFIYYIKNSNILSKIKESNSNADCIFNYLSQYLELCHNYHYKSWINNDCKEIIETKIKLREFELIDIGA